MKALLKMIICPIILKLSVANNQNISQSIIRLLTVAQLKMNFLRNKMQNLVVITVQYKINNT